MHLIFLKSQWEAPELGLEAFLQRVASDGFDGTELFLPALEEDADDVASLHEQFGLSLALSIVTEGSTPDQHVRDVQVGFARAAEYRPMVINLHAGRDIFAFDDNVRIFRRALEASVEHDIAVVLETHRRRPTYSAIETHKYLDALPALRLNADFSHWMVVHESDLSDQEETLDLAIRRSRHIHARVGYEQGPQVPDPRAPEWNTHLHHHIRLWRDIVDHCRNEGVERLCITPEFGPPPYQQTLPYTRQPMANVWDINVAMKNLLQAELG